MQVDDARINGPWRQRWLEIAELRSPLGDDDQEGQLGTDIPLPAPSGRACPECGALVINPFPHQAWHRTYVRRDGTEETTSLPVTSIRDNGRTARTMPG
jgi:hypothetical protein